MLLACIRSHLKSVLRNMFLILGSYHPDTLSLRENEGEDPWLFRSLPLQQAPRREITSSRSVSTAHRTLNLITCLYVHFLSKVITS
jgi:hypothetical protein